MDDEGDIMTLCRLLADENALFPMDEDLVRDLIRSVLSGHGFIGIIGEKGNLEGAILLQLTTQWYSREWLICELFNFVHPDYRVPGRAMQGLRTPGRADYLVEFAKSVADKMKMPLLIGIVSNGRTEAKVRLYDRKLPRAGAFYLYNGHTGLTKGAA